MQTQNSNIIRFSIYIDSTRVFGGIVNSIFEELNSFLESEGVKLDANNCLKIDKTDINEIRNKFCFFIKEKIELCYIEPPDDYNELRSWIELKIDDINYRLYSGTEEKKKLFYHFILYKTLLKSGSKYDIRIVLGDDIIQAGEEDPELYL